MTKKVFKTNVGGSRVVEKDDVKKASKKKVSKKTSTKTKGKDNVS
jgi:hypothetical protein